MRALAPPTRQRGQELWRDTKQNQQSEKALQQFADPYPMAIGRHSDKEIRYHVVCRRLGGEAHANLAAN